MAPKIITMDSLKDLRLKQNRSDVVKIYRGNAKHNLQIDSPSLITLPDYNSDRIIVPMSNADYINSPGYNKLWEEIDELKMKMNAAQSPTDAEITALIGKMFIDVTRRAQEAGDLTDFFATQINDENANETINLKYLYKYIGYMGLIAGSNDSVNLIEQKLGETDTFNLYIHALGWKDSLKNLLYNKIHDMQKVNQAAVDADTDYRNSQTIGQIVAATFVASQKQAADATSGATYDVKMYNTLRKAVKKLRGLKDPKTDRNIPTPKIFLLCNSADTWSIERVVRGQLTNINDKSTGVLSSLNLQALPISTIVEYDQGITDGFVYGKDTLSFSGVTAGKCYVYVPEEAFWVVNKRGLTLETGVGETLQLSTEERAWYRVDGNYIKDFLGSSYTGTSLGAGYGYIVEVTLPTDS
jgi:hypothetical protein